MGLYKNSAFEGRRRTDEGARYYDPVLGRFMGVDPKGFDPDSPQSFNRFSYANNNPYKYVDPDGHSPIDVAFLAYDIIKLGMALYAGAGTSEASSNVMMSAIGVVSPLPGAGLALKTARATEKGVETAQGIQRLSGVPGRVQSRINLEKSGMDHAISRHLSGKQNASQFTINETELRNILKSDSVIKSPISRVAESGEGARYIREVDVGRPIGVDKFGDGTPTSTMTIMTDKFGNLKTTFPGMLK